MEKRLIFSVLVFILLVQTVSAIDTEIKIKTFPNHEVQATAYDSESTAFTVLEGGKFIETTDQYGDVKFVFSFDATEFNLIIYVKDENGENVVDPEKILNHPAGAPLELRLAPEGFQLPETPVNGSTSEENATINETTPEIDEEITTQEDEQKNSSGFLAGSTIFGKDGIFSDKVLYVIIAVVSLVILFFGAKIARKKLSKKREIKVKKLSELKSEGKEKIHDHDEILEDAERKIKEAQQEINRLKNQDKIRETEKKLEEDKKQLEKLKRGED